MEKKTFELPSDTYIITNFVKKGDFGKVYLVKGSKDMKKYVLKTIDTKNDFNEHYKDIW